MIQSLRHLDETLLLWFNGFHTSFLDNLALSVSSRWLWLPLYVTLFALIARKVGWNRTLVYAAFPAHGRPHRLYLRLDSPPYFSAASTDAARQSDFPPRPRRAKLSRRALWIPLLPRVQRFRDGHALSLVF